MINDGQNRADNQSGEKSLLWRPVAERQLHKRRSGFCRSLHSHDLDTSCNNRYLTHGSSLTGLFSYIFEPSCKFQAHIVSRHAKGRRYGIWPDGWRTRQNPPKFITKSDCLSGEIGTRSF